MKEKKICFICSSGGHYSEIKRIILPEKYNSFFITERVKDKKNNFSKTTYLISEINRKEKLFLIKYIFLFMKELYIFLKEKPTHIITTGALCAYPMCKIAKFFKKKIIYVESYARVNDLSLTGKKIYSIADIFFVQWPELLEKYPKAIYVGSLFN